MAERGDKGRYPRGAHWAGIWAAGALLAVLALVVLVDGRVGSAVGRTPDGPATRRVLGTASSLEFRSGPSLIAAAAEAQSQGDLYGADAKFRAAWRDPETRVRAAVALHALHRTLGFRLPVDESAVEASLRALGPGFRRTETAHFVILSNCGPAWTQARARVLERTRDQFFRVAARMKAPVYPHRTKLLCVLFERRDEYAAFAQTQDGMAAEWVAGYYATLSNRIVFYNDSSGPGYSAADDRLDEATALVRSLKDQAGEAQRAGRGSSAAALVSRAEELDRQIRRERGRLGKAASACSTTKATHEVTHLLAFNTGLQLPDREYPFWLSEGLATSFESEQVDNAFGPDRPESNPPRRARFDELCESKRLIPLAELVAKHEAPADDGDLADVMYAQSYVLFSHLFAKDPEAVGRYFGDLAAGPGQGADPFATRFGVLPEIERRLLPRRSR